MSADLVRMRRQQAVNVRELSESHWAATGERLDAIAAEQSAEDVLEARERGLRRPISERAAGVGLTVAIGVLVAGGMWSPWFGAW